MLKVGLIGLGGISGTHINGWANCEDAEIVAVCDKRPEKFEKCPGTRTYTDIDEMLEKEQGNLDIIDICLPTYLHVDTAVKAMDRGFNVLTEKPISLNLEDVKRAYDCAKKNNVRFMVAQVLRFWTEFEFVKEIYDTKKYGNLLNGKMSRLGGIPRWSYNNWMQDEKLSGLVPFDLHIHDVDFMVYMLGLPKKFYTHRSKKPNQDYLMSTFEYDDFFLNIEASWYDNCHPFTVSFLFQFEEAVIELKDGQLMVCEKSGRNVIVNKIEEDGHVELSLPHTDAYANEIRYFADCVRQGKECDKVKKEELEGVITMLKSF